MPTPAEPTTELPKLNAALVFATTARAALAATPTHQDRLRIVAALEFTAARMKIPAFADACNEILIAARHLETRETYLREMIDLQLAPEAGE